MRGQLPHVRTFAICKIKVRFGALERVSVGPKRIKLRIRVDGSPWICMVQFAVVSELLRCGPRSAFVGTCPYDDFPARAKRLWSGVGGRDDSPKPIFYIQRAKVIVVIAGREAPSLPGVAGPTCCEPFAGAGRWSGFKTRAS